MNPIASQCAGKPCATGRVPARSRARKERMAAAGIVAIPAVDPQQRVQRGPGWVAVDSVALSQFR
ncbi:hypothetical protein GCM10027084_27970 [Pseudoxanthomonas sangjuensis]